MVEYYALNKEDVFKELKTSKKGLTKKEVEERLVNYGNNELKTKKKATGFKIFFRQFTDFLIILLLIATVISLSLKEYLDAIAMFSIVILSTILGFYQEYNAEKAIEALKKISAPTAKILRKGKVENIPAKDIVPGDIMLLEAGDIVPADSRIVEASSLQIDEASLTGESVPSKKHTNILKPSMGVSDQENMAFMSTIVTYGKATAIVTQTGMKSELGKIAQSLQTTKKTRTPLQKKFGKMAKQIGFAVIFLVFIVFITGLFRGGNQVGELIVFGLSLAVAAVPSSLPAIVTIGLSLGTKTLAKKNMIIKKLPAAESLGSATFICSDKTGTLTKNQMTITNIFVNNKTIDISGSGYEPKGNFYENKKIQNPKKYELLIRIGALCNNAKLNNNKGKYSIIGDPTEGSLVVLAEKGKFTNSNFKFVEELPFDSDRKCMSVIFNNKLNKKTEAYVKGAPDLLINKCNKIIINGKIKKLTAQDKKDILNKNNEFANKALRVLALAFREIKEDKYSIEKTENNLIFVGMVGMIDPARPEVKESIVKCNKAGIKVMVITGDYAITAKAVAKQIGLLKKGDLVLTGTDLEKMSDSELEKNIENVRIIARALPIQKLRIVDALQKKGHVVAMTGDGVNDSPAIKAADIGIALGSGTDIAKETADLVLLNNSFKVIVEAIKQGRIIFQNIKKIIIYVLTDSFTEMILITGSLLLGLPLPILPAQILWIKIIEDSVPSMALAFDDVEEGVMNAKKSGVKELLNKSSIGLIIFYAVIMDLSLLVIFRFYGLRNGDIDYARTITFVGLGIASLFYIYSVRGLKKSIFQINFFSNKLLTFSTVFGIFMFLMAIYVPFLNKALKTVPLDLQDWIVLCIYGLSSIIVYETGKKIFKQA